MRQPPHRAAIHLPPERSQAPEVSRFPAKRYMERYINPPAALAAERERDRAAAEQQRRAFPVAPERDVLGFLLHHAPLEDWQADLLDIIRTEAYYFAPQGQTKIMNEGWATYWHSHMMTRYHLREHELISTPIIIPARWPLGPDGYPLQSGRRTAPRHEERWNKGRFGHGVRSSATRLNGAASGTPACSRGARRSSRSAASTTTSPSSTSF
jgi:stage V sporulation protein R